MLDHFGGPEDLRSRFFLRNQMHFLLSAIIFLDNRIMVFGSLQIIVKDFS